MPLSYLREDCHKQAVTHIRESRQFKPMYTLQGKTRSTLTYASHSSPRTPGIRFIWVVPVCDNLSLAPTKSKQALTPGGSLGKQRQTDPTVILGVLIPPPMRQPWSRGERFRPNGHTAPSAY
jgi:hypothetical protein